MYCSSLARTRTKAQFLHGADKRPVPTPSLHETTTFYERPCGIALVITSLQSHQNRNSYRAIESSLKLARNTTAISHSVWLGRLSSITASDCWNLLDAEETIDSIPFECAYASNQTILLPEAKGTHLSSSNSWAAFKELLKAVAYFFVFILLCQNEQETHTSSYKHTNATRGSHLGIAHKLNKEGTKTKQT